MLWEKLIGATALNGLKFVGGVALQGAATQTPSFSLTSLTGGIGASPSIGDIVIACVAFNNGTDRDIQCTTSGYSEIADLYSNSSNDGQLAVYYKVLTASDTSVAFDLGVSTASVFAAHVWRGISATPLDATTTTAINTGRPNSPSITTVTNNAVVIAVGASGGATGGASLATPTVPTGMENFFQKTIGAPVAGIAIASVLVTPAGAYDPAGFGGFSGTASNGACAATIALRPA